MQSTLSASEIIALLELQPHPEGGHYRETFRDQAIVPGTSRSVGTCIYFLLQAGEVSHWHRVDASEVWHFYAGAPLELTVADGNGMSARKILGIDLAAGERPQITVRANHWQSARSLGPWTLVGCSVAPGFEFSGFELASPDWTPSTG